MVVKWKNNRSQISMSVFCFVVSFVWRTSRQESNCCCFVVHFSLCFVLSGLELQKLASATSLGVLTKVFRGLLRSNSGRQTNWHTGTFPRCWSGCRTQLKASLAVSCCVNADFFLNWATKTSNFVAYLSVTIGSIIIIRMTDLLSRSPQPFSFK